MQDGLLTKNVWDGGQNTDTTKGKIDPIFYTDAQNVEKMSDGNFKSLVNIRGTTNVKDIINVANTEVLGVFANTYLIAGANKKCLTIFTATTSGNFNIWCYDTESTTLYQLYQEAVSGTYLSSSRVVDAVAYAENNVDYLYFTDDSQEIRSVRCEIPGGYAPNFLTAAGISVQRLGANGAVVLDSVLTGGALLSGAYQFAYRMVDPVKKRFTKWSSLSHPIHVYSADNSSGQPVYSDYGLPTSFKIRLDISPSQSELDNFSYFQLAVVENIYPTGPEVVVDGQNQTFVASLLPIKLNSTYLVGSVLQNYDFKTNAKVGVVPIEEIVVDLAAIKNVGTINVKQNRLAAANITYHDLSSFDNGTPVSAGSIITHTSTDADLFSTHGESIYKGYFRDEVYRFGIVYKDKYGNRSPVKILDLSAITSNQISGGLTDVRFPSRSTSNSWTLFDTNSPSRLRSLGVQLANIHNHPTWAVGFEIVRAKRIKKILTQSPLVPMTFVRGVGALDDYPTKAVTVAGGAADNTYSSAQPQTTSKIYVPKNLLIPDGRVIDRKTSASGAGATLLKAGEGFLKRTLNISLSSIPSLGMIFPQDYMYGSDNNPYILSGAEKMQVIDYCAMKAGVTSYTAAVAGERGDTKVKGTFYALNSGDYYFDPAWAAKSITETPVQIKAAAAFKNLDVAQTLSGKSVMDYAALQTSNVDLGFQPKIQKGVVIDAPVDVDVHDIMGMKVLTFASAGTLNQATGGTAMFSSSPTLTYENNLSNKFINEYSNYVNNSSYVQALKIVNVVNNYGDDRYGDIDTQHEFISTGASYTFTTGELANVAAAALVNVTLDVWGGDCFVSPHTFKVGDGAYSLVNQYKNDSPASADSSAALIGRWIKYFLNTGGAAISLPIGLEGAAQYITVILESEYNGGVMAQDLLIASGTVVNNIPVLTSLGGEETLRSPLTYRYNVNLSKQNDEKVYFPLPAFNFVKSDFPSRIVYSDQKIYNTDEIGFDVFRVLNFLDLEEKNGEITKLAIERDNLYAIQERGVVGLPVGETQINTTDAGQLSVGTASFFGRYIVIDNKRGGQHLKGIVETGDVVFIPDNDNKAVYALADNKLENISDLNNATLFRNKFSTVLTKRNLIGVYDPQRKEYWVAGTDFCQRFNFKEGQWVGNYEFPASSLKGGVFTNLGLYLVGKIVNQISAYSMYTGSANTLFGTVVVPRVTFVVNPDGPITKLFDDQMYEASERLASVDFTVEREAALGNQNVVGTVLDLSSYGVNFRIKLPRAAGTSRFRGLRLITTVKWKTDGVTYSTLSQVLTKYRRERRIPF